MLTEYMKESFKTDLNVFNHFFVLSFLMYLKVFLGMGFLWTMEIVAGLASDTLHESVW